MQDTNRQRKGKQSRKNAALHPYTHTHNLHVKESTHFHMDENTMNGLFCRWYLVHAFVYTVYTMQTLVSLFQKHNYSIYAEIYLRKEKMNADISPCTKNTSEQIQFQRFHFYLNK